MQGSWRSCIPRLHSTGLSGVTVSADVCTLHMQCGCTRQDSLADESIIILLSTYLVSPVLATR